MHVLSTLAVLGAASVQSAQALPSLFQQPSVDSWIKTQLPLAWKGILCNIGPDGCNVKGQGVAPGLVIASPSRSDPDYFYTWTRDAALTFKTIVDDFIFGNKALQPYIEGYIHSQAKLQTVSNPSGSLLPNGHGLGEPKYHADGSRYNGNWGRPQRDGPPLRAVALITYSNYLISKGQSARVKTEIWPVIANDLSYVGQYWNSSGFDLWEEVSGSSFFTTQNQYRSLVEGATLAKTLGLSCPSCSVAPQVLCFLQSYWNGKFFTANFITGTHNRGGVDANTILGAIASFDPYVPCDSPSLQPCHPRSLANFKNFVDTFRDPALYPINQGNVKSQGIALGRYPEDFYYNGNPWYLIVHGAAEFLYDAIAAWKQQGSITIDSTSLPFFKDLYPLARTGTFGRLHPAFYILQGVVKSYADSFVAVSQKYTPKDGTQAEQFVKTAPFAPISAANLTWSYASFVGMKHRRDGHLPPKSWVPKGLTLPKTCERTTVQGVYVPATAAGAPNVTIPCISTIRLQLNASTYYGENLYVTGNSPTLGNWDLDVAYPLMSSNYTAERPLWYADLPLEMPEGVTTLKYKYARQQDCGQDWIVEEEERTLEVPQCRKDGSEVVQLETDEAFRGPGGKSGGC
ncbi:family 15 putative glycoside hydrolase [Podospora australis]|uniref:Glucoamylase n=1 Tax=Podospora australis TaxID=1536484 RepID=A0AAN6X335_9PEZI|nr:family 15 putative glycoside hydrolase [Podospora australis]